MAGCAFSLAHHLDLGINCLQNNKIGGIMPLECLLWSLMLIDLAINDVLAIWTDIHDLKEARQDA